MRKVIVPTDFSKNAYNAIKYAVQLFKNTETTLYLLHTYTPPVYQAEYLLGSPGQIGLGDRHQVRAMEKLEKLEKRLHKEFKNEKHTYKTWAVLSTLVDEVLETIQNEKADLVIMGTQGATGAKEILFGTNTINVIQKTTCPVIAVPADFQYENPTEILFPTDYEIGFDEEKLQQFLDIARVNNSNIDVIHINSGSDLTDDQLQNKQKLSYLIAHIDHIFHDLPNQGVIEAINNFQTDKPTNLLVMVRNKHTFLERLFIEPVIKKIGFHIDIPFMVIPYLD